ncbi:hypothetical protein BpHYR1_006760 [Brachionus plicatilis]|uniref:Uncharacterized protein n=1 Tax=Brachionus plicatilis TaxID=10195 RepID=A0A3M7SHA5_BRAPC|nr:hypothetical protein BpHYR1_006760 [Brachionus plicatilis]
MHPLGSDTGLLAPEVPHFSSLFILKRLFMLINKFVGFSYNIGPALFNKLSLAVFRSQVIFVLKIFSLCGKVFDLWGLAHIFLKLHLHLMRQIKFKLLVMYNYFKYQISNRPFILILSYH